MRLLGLNALNHDAAVCVVEDNKIVFASHSERYSKIKNDPNLNHDIMDKALSYGKPDKVVWFERPYLKKTRQFYAGQYSEVFDVFNIPSQYLKKFNIYSNIKYVSQGSMGSVLFKISSRSLWPSPSESHRVEMENHPQIERVSSQLARPSPSSSS